MNSLISLLTISAIFILFLAICWYVMSSEKVADFKRWTKILIINSLVTTILLAHWFISSYGEFKLYLAIALLCVVLNGVVISNGFKLGFKNR